MLDYLRYYFNIIVVLAGVAGYMLGGQWVWIGFLGVLVFLLVADYITEEDEAERKIKNPWIADFALYLHFPLMILLFGSFAWRIQQGFSEPTAFMTVLAYAGCIFSAAFLGNAPNLPIAHELFHRRHWFPRYLGTTLNVYFGDPVKDIQHVYNHHIHVGTLKDPDTPRRGESVYKFIFRATWHSYKESYKIEKERQRKKGRSVWSWRSRITQMFVLFALLIGSFYYVSGWLGALLVTIHLVVAKLLAEVFNYTQHYGLIRAEGTPFHPRHTWEQRTFFSRVFGVEITTHAHHHIDSYAPFYELKPSTIDNKMPSLVICFLIALVPPLWFRFVQQKLKKMDLLYATPEEKILAREANKRAGWPDWFDETRVS